MPDPPKRLKYMALLAVAPLLWAGNQVTARGIHEQISPIALNFWRGVIGIAFLFIIAGPAMRRHWPVLRAHWRQITLLGFVGAALFQIVLYWGLSYTTAINAVVLNSSLPVFMIALSWLLVRETVTARQVAGGLVSFVGVLVIVARADVDVLRNLAFGFGDILILVAMVLWALYSVLIRRLAPPVPPLVLLTAMLVAGTGFMFPLFAFDVIVLGNHTVFSPGVILAVVYVAIFVSVLAVLCWNIGVQKVGANIASFIYHMLPAYGTVLAILFLGERFRPYHGLGLALILVGVLVSTHSSSRSAMPRTGSGG